MALDTNLLQLKDWARASLADRLKMLTNAKALGEYVPSSAIKQTLRAQSSMIFSGGLYGDLLEEAMSNNWSPQELANKLRYQSETLIPKQWRVNPFDRLHHETALGTLLDSVKGKSMETIEGAVDIVTGQGFKVGEQGLVAPDNQVNSLIEPVHTGADQPIPLPNGTKVKIGKGHPILNAHGGDTTGKRHGLIVPNDPTITKASDLADSWQRSLKIQQASAAVGRAAGSDVAEVAQEIFTEATGSTADIYDAANVSERKAAQTILKSTENQRRVLSSFNKGNVAKNVKRFGLSVGGNLLSAIPSLADTIPDEESAGRLGKYARTGEGGGDALKSYGLSVGKNVLTGGLVSAGLKGLGATGLSIGGGTTASLAAPFVAAVGANVALVSAADSFSRGYWDPNKPPEESYGVVRNSKEVNNAINQAHRDKLKLHKDEIDKNPVNRFMNWTLGGLGVPGY